MADASVFAKSVGAETSVRHWPSVAVKRSVKRDRSTTLSHGRRGGMNNLVVKSGITPAADPVDHRATKRG
jgi:hypothetical protein